MNKLKIYNSEKYTELLSTRSFIIPKIKKKKPKFLLKMFDIPSKICMSSFIDY